MALPQLVNNSNAAALVTASGNGEYLLSLLVNKATRTFRGRAYVLEEAITTDFALVRASPGDRHGNLVFHRSAANFNPLAAMAGRTTIAEVEELVERLRVSRSHRFATRSGDLFKRNAKRMRKPASDSSASGSRLRARMPNSRLNVQGLRSASTSCP